MEEGHGPPTPSTAGLPQKALGPGAGWSRALPALYAGGRFWPSLSLLAFQGNLVSSFPPEIDALEGSEATCDLRLHLEEGTVA